MLRGNHDPEQNIFADILGHPPDYLDLKGVRFIPFIDKDEPGCNASRSRFDIKRMYNLGVEFTGPLVFLQHVPLFPPELAKGYYNYTNAAEILNAIKALPNQTLTIAGHEHAGMPMINSGKDHFIVAPALCETPFQYLIVELSNHNITYQVRQLLTQQVD